MELRAGYKQTDVGIFPENWELDYIRNIARISTGNKNTQDRQDNGLYPFFVRSQKVERINTYSFDGEAVLTAGDGVGTGKVFHYINGKFDTHQRVYRISDFSGDINGYYFYLYFSTHFYSRIMQMTAKSSVDSVRFEMIADMPIPIPPTLTEQEAIATVLSDADALIASLEQLITKKLHIKQGAMQELLVKGKRLPGFTGRWEIKKLGDVGRCLRGVSYDPDLDLSAHDTDTTIRLFRANNVKQAVISPFDIQFVESRRVSEMQIMRQDDILICTASGSKDLVGKAGLFRIADGYNYTFGAFMGCFRTDQHIAKPEFVSYLFQTKRFRDLVSVILSGTSINNLKPSDIEACEFLVPEKPEQKAIAAILSNMDAEIETLKTKLPKSRLIKQGMMHELLAGRIRLV